MLKEEDRNVSEFQVLEDVLNQCQQTLKINFSHIIQSSKTPEIKQELKDVTDFAS